MSLTKQVVGASGILSNYAAQGDVVVQPSSNAAVVATGSTSLTVSNLFAKNILRSGATANFTDTLPTLAQIVAETADYAGNTIVLNYVNNTVYNATLAAGAGLTFSGDVTVPSNSVRNIEIALNNTTAPKVVVGATTNASKTVTGLTSEELEGITIGMVVTGSGIPANTKVESVQTNKSVTLTLAATATDSAVSLTFSPEVVVTFRGVSKLQGAEVYGTSSVTLLNTVGAGTITAAALVSGVVIRGGTQAGSITDAVDSVANLITALGNVRVGESFDVTFMNKTVGNWTQTFPPAYTLATLHTATISSNSWQKYRFVVTSATTVDAYLVESGKNFTTAPFQFTTRVAATGTASNFEFDGSAYVIAEYTGSAGAFTRTTPTAQQMLNAWFGQSTGHKWMCRVANRNNATMTLVGGTGVTISGTATTATNTWTDYLVQITTDGTTATMTNVGSGSLT